MLGAMTHATQLSTLQSRAARLREALAGYSAFIATARNPDPLPRLQDLPVVPPHVRRDARGLELDHPDRKYLRGLVLYRSVDDGWKVDRILGPRTDRLVLGPGSWALSAVTRTGTESRGVRIVIADDGDAVSEAPAGR